MDFRKSPSMKVPPKRKGNGYRPCYTSIADNPSMKVPPKRKGNFAARGRLPVLLTWSLNESPSEKEGKSARALPVRGLRQPSMKVPPKRKGNVRSTGTTRCERGTLNESPSEKEGKCAQHITGRYFVRPSMKVPPKRKGNSYPKIARNHAAETGASREPRGGYTQNYTLQPHLPPHNSLAREETMRATRHVPVTYQVLAHTKTPAGCFLSDPARVLTYERGWRGSGKPD